MVGVVVVTHGQLGSELLKTAAGIVGPLEKAVPVSIDASETCDKIKARISRAMAEVDDGAGVLVLTDMFGGTPNNLSLGLMGERQLEVVSGCNLPMLLKLSTARGAETPLIEVARMIAGYGQKHISCVTDTPLRRCATEPAAVMPRGSARH